MPQSDRAPKEVAKHFYHKYGHDESVAIISARIHSDVVRQDCKFWLDVIKNLNELHNKSDDTSDNSIQPESTPEGPLPFHR